MSNLVPLQDIQAMAAAIARSGLFGLKTPDQAIALMLIAQAEGRHPAEAARDYDVIQGRPAKKAEAMLRDFLTAGGKVEWHALDDTKADATFTHAQGGSVRISWDMERAKKAQLGGKDMWTKYPRQMLRSRCVSEGVRTVWPLATSGMYVPEEVKDFEPREQREPRDMGTAEVVRDEPPPRRPVVIDAEYLSALEGVIKRAETVSDLQAIHDDAMAVCKEANDRESAKEIKQWIKARKAELQPEAQA